AGSTSTLFFTAGINDEADGLFGSLTATVGGTATVTEGDVLTASPVTITTTEGAAFTGTVATFSDTLTSSPASDFTATINWGDGTTTAGTITGGSGSFTVSGSHTYAEDGSFAVAVTLADNAPGTASAVANSTANVSELPISGAAVAINGFERSPLTNVNVASFTHGNGAEPAASFTATINWGDGASSAGTIVSSGGAYQVQGTHTYLDERTFPVSVVVTDSTSSATFTANATILE